MEPRLKYLNFELSCSVTSLRCVTSLSVVQDTVDCLYVMLVLLLSNIRVGFINQSINHQYFLTWPK